MKAPSWASRRCRSAQKAAAWELAHQLGGLKRQIRACSVPTKTVALLYPPQQSLSTEHISLLFPQANKAAGTGLDVPTELVSAYAATIASTKEATAAPARPLRLIEILDCWRSVSSALGELGIVL